MFGFLEHSEDHGNFIASMESLLPFICISAVAPTYMRALIVASGIFLPAVWKALKAMDGLRRAAVEAASKRRKDLEDGVAHRSDLLQQLFNIVREKGDKVNFSHDEAALESYVAM
jgi:hypothetical protein